jgi:steroid delta-isomerase-like uncharacterized protein
MGLTDDERSARVVRAIEATVSGDTSTVKDLFTDDVVAWSPTGAATSRVELAVEIEDYEEAFSEVEVSAGSIVAARHRVCAEWVATAKHSGALIVEDGSCVSPTSRRVSVHGVTVAEFHGERICTVRHYWDEAGLLSELGVALEG